MLISFHGTKKPFLWELVSTWIVWLGKKSSSLQKGSEVGWKMAEVVMLHWFMSVKVLDLSKFVTVEWKKVGVAVNHLNIIVPCQCNLIRHWKLKRWIPCLCPPLYDTSTTSGQSWFSYFCFWFQIVFILFSATWQTKKRDWWSIPPRGQPTPNLLLNSPGVSTENLQSG